MFSDFKKAIDKQMTMMENHSLFVTTASKDDLWTTYLAAFPEGSNPLYKERTEHDCQCCKQFIRAAGAMVSIIDGEVVSIWDCDIDGDYGVVAKKMSEFVRSHSIAHKFLHYLPTVGTDKSHQDDDGKVITWEHFYYKLPSYAVMPKASIPTAIGEHRTSVETFNRALNEITPDALETVLELIAQKSLYRGDTYLDTLKKFKGFKAEYDTAKNKEVFVWENTVPGAVSGIRNSSIGTLLVDLSAGMDINDAVTRFEKVVAPENYKRPTALITKGMIQKAEAKVTELGLTDSLARRYATIDDLTIEDPIFVNRDAKKAMGIFDELAEGVADKMPNLDKIEEIDIDDFVELILPKASAIEMMVENTHENNFVSLIAPVNSDAPNILKWDNNFSWSYNGEVADSMKQRVAKAGGDINGVLRASLQWNDDKETDKHIDLDLHCIEANGNKIYYPKAGTRQSSSGMLDVDNTNPGRQIAVENITWSRLESMYEGLYQIQVHNYDTSTCQLGFTVEIEFANTIYTFVYPKKVRGKETVNVATVKFSRANGFEIVESLPSTVASREIWGVTTHKFQNVSMIMHSPNYWAGQRNGNKHWFFMLTNCVNPDSSRGFYNEFLRDDLSEHRKVFEVLGSKLKAPASPAQLSGVGFSSTQRNTILCRVTGAFSRVLKINF